MALRLNDSNSLVKKWQQFLKAQGFLSAEPNSVFGPKTQLATKNFQKFYSVQQTGIADSLTLGKATALGFNPENAPQPEQIKNDKQMMQWIKNNLGSTITQAIEGSAYAEDWLAGMCARETGFLFTRYANQGNTFEQIVPLMKGDYSKRKNNSQKIFHGFGFWQIDIDSFPGFIHEDRWKSALETAVMSVKVLDGKMKFLQQKGWKEKLSSIMFERAVTAAYNCGEGGVNKALTKGLDVDAFTYSNDYSREVFRYRGIYSNL